MCQHYNPFTSRNFHLGLPVGRSPMAPEFMVMFIVSKIQRNKLRCMGQNQKTGSNNIFKRLSPEPSVAKQHTLLSVLGTSSSSGPLDIWWEPGVAITPMETYLKYGPTKGWRELEGSLGLKMWLLTFYVKAASVTHPANLDGHQWGRGSRSRWLWVMPMH